MCYSRSILTNQLIFACAIKSQVFADLTFNLIIILPILTPGRVDEGVRPCLDLHVYIVNWHMLLLLARPAKVRWRAEVQQTRARTDPVRFTDNSNFQPDSLELQCCYPDSGHLS